MSLRKSRQVAFAVGDFFVNDDAVETLLRRLGQQFFRDGDVFLRRETQAVDDAFHRDFGFLDFFADLDFLFAREQRNLAHLVHIHANRIVENFQARIILDLFRLLGLLAAVGALGLGLVHDDFHVEAAQLAQQRVEIVGAQIIRQNVVDVVVSDVAVLLAEMHQRLDRLGQIHRGRRRYGRARARLAIGRQFLRRRLDRSGCVLGLAVRFRRLGRRALGV